MAIAAYINQKVVPGMVKDLNNPQSSSYLPKLIQTTTKFDPQNSPYVGYASGSWTMGNLTGQAGEQAAENICTAVQPYGEIYIPTPGATPFINLTNVHIKNLSQVRVHSFQAYGPDNAIYFLGGLEWGDLTAHGIQGIQITADFKLSQTCCASSDNKTCNPNSNNDQVGTGTMTLTMPTATATGNLPLTKLAQNVLTIGVNSLTFESDTSKMTVSVCINNIPHKEMWEQHAEKALNSTMTLENIISKIQEQLNNDKSQIGQAFTQNIDQYLENEHQYPYGPMTAMVF